MAGIYIHGMEMPTDFRIIVICGDGTVTDYIPAPYANVIGKAIPVPDHGRCVDADALEEGFKKLVHQDNWYYNELHHAPTIIPADKEDAE